MTRTEIEDRVADMVDPLLSGTDIELVDVEYVQERDWYLRVFIDKPDGVGIDDCELVSRQLEPLLDEADFLKQAYYLEVSSPGLDRVLRRERDFERYAGRMVDMKFFRPQSVGRQCTGTLEGLVDGMISVVIDGKQQRFSREDVASIRLHISFGQAKK